MDLRISNVEPKYENQKTTGEIVSVNGYANDSSGDYVNARLTLVSSDLTDGKAFDDLTSKDLSALAKKKLAAYTAMEA